MYRVTATVTVRIEEVGAGRAGLGRGSEMPGAVIEQSVARSTGGPSESYCYLEAADAIDEASLTVLTMMEAAYGKTERQQ